MKWLPLLALLSLAAVSADENRQFRVAQAAFEDKLYDVAARQFQDFLQKFPNSDRADDVHFLLGQSQVHLGRWEEAVTTLQEAATRWPEQRPDSIQFWLGEAFTRGGRFAEAEARYAQVVQKHPRSAFNGPALYGMAFAQLKLAQFSSAADSLELLTKTQPKGELAFEADLLRAQLHLARQEHAVAEAVLTAVAEKAGTSRAFYRAQYWHGESLQRHGQHAAALPRYAAVTDAFKARPNKPVDAQLAAEAWFGTGWTLLKMERFGDAAEAFNEALLNATTPGLKRDALLKLSEARLRTGKVGEGVANLKEFLRIHPQDSLADEVQFTIAGMLYSDNNPLAALAEYTTLIATYPESPWLGRAYREAGWCAWLLNKPADALLFFEKALPRLAEPEAIIETLGKIGDAQFALAQFPAAAATYRSLLEQFPTDARADRALFQLGEAYRQIPDATNAVATYSRLVRDFPASEQAPQAQYSLGQILSSQAQEAEARAAYAVVVAKFPASTWANNAALAIGESFTREGKYAEAIAEFDALTRAGLESELAQQAFYNRGWCHALSGKRDLTLAEFLDFLKAKPQAPLAPNVQFWVAHEYLRRADYVKAQEHFQSMAETYPQHREADAALYFAGRAAYARQDFRAAIGLYEALMKKFPQSTWRCHARFGQGDASSELGQFNDALLIFESILKDPKGCLILAEAYGRHGDCHYSLGRYEDALASYRGALEATKDQHLRIQILSKLGQAYEALKKPAEAFQNYAAALYEATANPEPTEPPERFWSCRAARAAANVKEQQADWREAIVLYEKMAGVCVELKALAEDRIRKLRVQHPETLFPR